MKLFELKLELKAKLEFAILIPPALWPTDHWSPEGLAALASPTLVTRLPELPVEDKGVVKFWKLVANPGQWLTNVGGPDQI